MLVYCTTFGKIGQKQNTEIQKIQKKNILGEQFFFGCDV
jgi:hypothetical protein